MNILVLTLIRAVFIGLGATLTFDLWGLFLKRAFQMTPSNICLVGRWLRYMPEGTFTHSNLGVAPRKSAECTVGWITHYLIGITFAIIFVGFAGNHWLQQAIQRSLIDHRPERMVVSSWCKVEFVSVMLPFEVFESLRLRLQQS